jgi:hypothetical protein
MGNEKVTVLGIMALKEVEPSTGLQLKDQRLAFRYYTYAFAQILI